MQESRKRKKPTKKEMQQKVVDTFQTELKRNYIKALVQGREIFAQTILDNIANGKTLDDIKRLCEVSLHSKEITEQIAMNEKEKENK